MKIRLRDTRFPYVVLFSGGLDKISQWRFEVSHEAYFYNFVFIFANVITRWKDEEEIDRDSIFYFHREELEFY